MIVQNKTHVSILAKFEKRKKTKEHLKVFISLLVKNLDKTILYDL